MGQAGKLFVGTSGYAYKEWKGSFYPEKISDKEMLSFYGKNFATVEINYSFYRMPTESALQKWAGEVPQGFRFALKANQRITHILRLRDCEAVLKRFLEVASVLVEGDHLGPILVQVPPNLKFDAPLLEDFLALRPPAFSLAFEARHPSWYTDQTYEVLRRHQTALCLSETEKLEPPTLVTAPFAYIRLRLEEYSKKQLTAWRARFDEWTDQGLDVYAYCKHEDAGKGAKYAKQLLGKSK